MKLVTYSKDRTVSCGILSDDRIIDIPGAWHGPNPPRSVRQVLEKGPSCLEEIAELADSAAPAIPAASLKLGPPITCPGKIIALAGNYAEHIKEAGKALGLSDSPRLTTVPRPFIMPSTALIGPEDEIPWPEYSKTIDYEIELAVVMGRKAKHVPPEKALDFIAGYTIVNDVSARTVTFKQGRAERPWDEFYDWLNGKWADGFCPMGPYLLTADEVEDVQNLDMTLTVNGKVRQNANTRQMIYPVVDIVSFLSHLMTLEPGDVIATGTPAGVALASGDYLQPGDKIQCKIQNLGTLTNTLGAKPKEFYEPLTRPL